MKSLFIFILSLLSSASSFADPVKIVSSLTDMGSIASYIGGDKVEVTSIAKANGNPHSVEVFPSFMAKVSKADIYLKCGLGLDQWADEIIDGSRNNRILIIDCSEGIQILEKPAGKVDASMGDVHPYGNPHYWLNPRNGIVIAKNILSALQKQDPSNSEYYSERFKKFEKECNDNLLKWQTDLQIIQNSKIITYHSSWAYFANAFNFVIIAKVEPFPGIPPTGKHLAELIKTINNEHVSFIIQEPYFPDDATKFLNRQTNVKVIKISPSCNDMSPLSYFKHFDVLINQIKAIH
jgi:zinc/manganese transport system substrate-binding protein